MAGCSGCTYNHGKVAKGPDRIKCGNKEKARELDEVLGDNNRYGRFFQEKGYIVLFDKKEADCSTLNK